MTENKEIIKAGGVFITHRTREAIYATAAQRTEPELKMRLRTILKDECIKTKEAREYIGKYINIIGIEEI